jgi:hypothetical protein
LKKKKKKKNRRFSSPETNNSLSITQPASSCALMLHPPLLQLLDSCVSSQKETVAFETQFSSNSQLHNRRNKDPRNTKKEEREKEIRRREKQGHRDEDLRSSSICNGLEDVDYTTTDKPCAGMWSISSIPRFSHLIPKYNILSHVRGQFQ